MAKSPFCCELSRQTLSEECTTKHKCIFEITMTGLVYFFQNMHHAYKSCSSHMEQESEKVYIVKYIIFKYFHIVSKYQLFSLRDCVTIF